MPISGRGISTVGQCLANSVNPHCKTLVVLEGSSVGKECRITENHCMDWREFCP